MPSVYGLARGFFNYISDNGTHYQVALTLDDGSAGGFASTVYGTLPVYPRGWKMRIQYGLGPLGQRTKTPVADPGSAQWTSPTSFTKNSILFAAEGCIGEKRTAKS